MTISARQFGCWLAKDRANARYNVKVWGDIPIQAGLSSSSALVVAWIRFALKNGSTHQQFSAEKIAHWSYTSEVWNLTNPGD